MKFSEYMKSKNSRMSEENKLLIFDELINNIHRRSIFSKIFMYTKVSVYSFIVLFVASGIFFHYWQEKTWPIQQNINSVNADYIWKIVKSTWEFEIINTNNTIWKELIKQWSTLNLWENSTITLKVNEWIKLYLVGPAKVKFDSYRNSNLKTIYTLNMLDWDYITVKSNSSQDKIILKSNLLNVESNENIIDLKYEKKWNAMIVENNWWNITVKKDNNLLSVNKEEKIIFWDNSVKEIENIFTDQYKKYQVDSNWKVKIILNSDKIKKFWNLLERKNTILTIWKYVLWHINKDEKRKEQGKQQLENTIKNIYNLLELKMPDLLDTKIRLNNLSNSDLESLVYWALEELNATHVVPWDYINKLKIILAYLVIVEKRNTSNNHNFPSLSSLLNYINIDSRYKKIMLQF